MTRLYIHAPNVHVGGGGVLLKALLEAPNLGAFRANLDARAAAMLALPETAPCHFVPATLQGRADAERRLAAEARDDDVVLCFHGLPPMLPVRGRVIVFKQNRLHLDTNSLSGFSWKTRIRLSMERLICKMFRNRVHEYIVQTPSMKLAVENWHGGAPIVRVIPFLSELPALPAAGKETMPVSAGNGELIDGEFIYVADGEAHKNHSALVSAWILLAAEGIFPALTLTLPPRNAVLWQDIETAIATHELRIVNLGTLTHAAVLARYRAARALIFPSTTESFGLPLLEASAAGLPVIAAELDYVRDVCEPRETFDPTSPRSIAAAVKRFLNIPSKPLHIRTAAEFIAEIVA